MAIQFEDILAALCSQVTLSHANESQKMYLVRDAKEARLARDVLVAYGFDAKAYDKDNASRLYIASPSLDSALVEQKLSAALAYAISLKQIKQSLDTLCHDHAPALQSPDYNITFANMQPAGKQIVIHLTPPAHLDTSVLHAPASIPPSRVTQAVSARPARAKNRPSASADQSFFSGPAVGKKSYQRAFKRKSKPDSLWQQMYSYLSGHMVASVYGMFLAVVFLIVLFTAFTFSKAFLCPDFATAKRNTAWYCQQMNNSP